MTLVSPGEREEYRYAADWLSELYTFIDDGCEATTRIICAPGNHDLDHSGVRKVRSTLVDRVTKDPSLADDEEVVAECVKEQKAFFDFRTQLEGEEILVHDDPLLRIHRIRDEQSAVQINILNSAWMSSLNEQQGSLIYPITRYADQLRIPNGFSIAVVHHPLNWFATQNSRELRNELSRCSSVVLYGHEHIPDDTQLLTAIGEHVRFIDGGVLRDSGTSGSSFNVILLDTDVAKIKILGFHRKGRRYEVDRNGDWQDATRLASAESGRFRLRTDQKERLDDIGANILHPRHDRVTLRDLFVYPDLLPVDDDISKVRNRIKKTVSAERLLYGVESSHVILYGDESAGKTALLRMLFTEYYSKGKIPLYVSCAQTSCRTVARFRNLLERSYGDTYEGEDFTQYEQLAASQRVLLLDDVDFEGKGTGIHADVLDFVRQFADKAVVVVNDLLSVQNYATRETRAAIFNKYSTFHLQQLGHVKRDEMIKRWILLGQQPRDWATPETLTRRDELRSVINTTIGKNLVPSRPIFLLTILQSTDTMAPTAVGSTYGHYYQFLITSALMESGVKSEDLDAVFN